MEIFKLFGTVALKGLDEFNQDVDDASEKGNKLGSAIGKGLQTAAKVGIAAVTAAATAVATLTKASLDSYAEYEQLVGGAELLYGEAFDFVAEKSANAYATVQMSQNEYLQQVNGFATGLKTALGGNERAAAELADKIITAEADIVAATGQSQEAVQNAFNGIMKSNFTMLDNLQMGITPTKEGFQEVIDKVNEWNAANGRATAYQIDNLADCQSALVDYIEMQGLAGYAANEAAGTISGSIAMTKAAWSNLLTGLADENANLEVLVNNFTQSVAITAENLLPRIQQILLGIGTMIEQLAPVIAAAIPELVTQVVPGLIGSGVSMVMALLEGINSSKDTVISGAYQVVHTFINGMIEVFPMIITTGIDLLVAFVSSINGNSAEMMIDAALQLVTNLATSILDNLPQIIQAGMQLVLSLIYGIFQKIPDIIAAAGEIIWSLCKGLFGGEHQIVSAGSAAAAQYAVGVESESPTVFAAGTTTGEQYVAGIESTKGDVSASGVELGASFTAGVDSQTEAAYSVGAATGVKASEGVASSGSEANLSGVNVAGEIIAGVESKKETAYSTGAMIAQKVIEGFQSLAENIKSVGAAFVNYVTEGITAAHDYLFNSGVEIVNKIKAGIDEAWDGLATWFDRLCRDTFNASVTVEVSGKSTSGSAYTASVTKNAKGAVFDAPTIFDTRLGYQMVGEAGAEAVAPIAVLQKYVADAVASQNIGIVTVLESILAAINEMDGNMGESMKEALDGTALKLNNREFGRMVKAVSVNA